MAPTLYMLHASPPVRAVLITAKAIGLDLNEKTVNFFHDERSKQEFGQLNPQRTIPTLVDDDGFAIWDSHAIMAYLVSKYSNSETLYPVDAKKRAIINQRLYFESGVVFYHAKNIAQSILIDGAKRIKPKDRQGVLEAYGFLDKFLEGQIWVAGDCVTIADHSLISSVSSLNKLIPVDPGRFPNVVAWLRRSELLPEYEANEKGLREGFNMLNKRLSMK